jgi:hypothetical protein
LSGVVCTVGASLQGWLTGKHLRDIVRFLKVSAKGPGQ